MYNSKIKYTLLSLFCVVNIYAQNIQVETIADLNASGGVTFGPDGNIYISDFGPALGTPSSNTKVYKMEYGSWDISEYATGFSGASGSRFDSQGNFYQSNPSGGRVSKRTSDGIVDYNWATNGITGPIGITNDSEDNLYVCNCGNNTIQKITPDGNVSLFASSSLLNCPNGITIDPNGNFYVGNFNNGRILKIAPDGTVSNLATLPIYNGVGIGHLTYSNGFLFVAAIGVGQIFKISLTGETEVIAGAFQGFSNFDGPAMDATFSKPNGVAASITGDTLWVNCSVPTWPSNNLGLHPGLVRMITGVCSLEDVNCPLLSSTKDKQDIMLHERLKLFPLRPNPATSVANISFEIYGQRQAVALKIVDHAQRLITIIFSGQQSPGQYSHTIDTDQLSAGTYYVILENEYGSLKETLLVVH